MKSSSDFIDEKQDVKTQESELDLSSNKLFKNIMIIIMILLMLLPISIFEIITIFQVQEFQSIMINQIDEKFKDQEVSAIIGIIPNKYIIEETVFYINPNPGESSWKNIVPTVVVYSNKKSLTIDEVNIIGSALELKSIFKQLTDNYDSKILGSIYVFAPIYKIQCLSGDNPSYYYYSEKNSFTEDGSLRGFDLFVPFIPSTQIIMAMLIYMVIIFFIFKFYVFNRKLFGQNGEEEKVDIIANDLQRVNFQNSKSYEFIIDRPFYKVNYKFCIDTINRQFAFIDVINESTQIIEFDSIVSCDVIVDNDIIASGGIGRAVVGGIIAGGVGAIVGASTRKNKKVIDSLKIRFITNIVTDSKFNIELIKNQIPSDIELVNLAKEFAENVFSAAQSVLSSNTIVSEIRTQAENGSNNYIENSDSNNSDTIKRLQNLEALKEKCLISEEEYNTKRTEILNTI